MAQKNNLLNHNAPVSNVRRAGRPPLYGPAASANPLNTLNAAERRDLFLETAARLFNEQGVKNTSISHITQALGLSKAIFYYYWGTKQEIIEEIHARALNLLNQRLDEVQALSLSASETIRQAIRVHLDGVINCRSLVSITADKTVLSKELLAHQRAYTLRFQKLIEWGMEQGVVRHGDPRLIVFAVLGMCNSVGRWFKDGASSKANQVIDLFTDIATRGYTKD